MGYKRKCTVMVGLPGSGKTTKALEDISNAEVIDCDEFVSNDYSQKQNIVDLITHVNSLGTNSDIILDGLFITKAVQTLLFEKLEYDVSFIFMDTDKKTCEARDTKRLFRTESARLFIKNNDVHNPQTIAKTVIIVGTSEIDEILPLFDISYKSRNKITSSRQVLEGSCYGSCWDDEDNPMAEPNGYDQDEAEMDDFYSLYKIVNNLEETSGMVLSSKSKILQDYASVITVENDSEGDYYGGTEYYNVRTALVLDVVEFFFYENYGIDVVSRATINKLTPEIFL